MVTQFNRKDLASFGNYILHLINTGQKEPDPSGKYEVTHANIENWKHLKDSESDLINSMQSMCEESLDPESFSKWEDVKNVLEKTRLALM